MNYREVRITVTNLVLGLILIAFIVFCIWTFWDGWHCDAKGIDGCSDPEHRSQVALAAFLITITIIATPVSLIAFLIKYGDKEIKIPLPTFSRDKKIDDILDEMAFTNDDNRLRELVDELEKLRR